MILINKTYNVNIAQLDINRMKNVDMTYIDSYLAEFPTLIGNGPFLLFYSNMLEKYVKNHGWNIPDKKYCANKRLRDNIKKYEKMYRIGHIHNLKIIYGKDESLYDFFSPEHLIMFYEKTYELLYPCTWREKARHMGERLFRKIAKIFL